MDFVIEVNTFLLGRHHESSVPHSSSRLRICRLGSVSESMTLETLFNREEFAFLLRWDCQTNALLEE